MSERYIVVEGTGTFEDMWGIVDLEYPVYRGETIAKIVVSDLSEENAKLLAEAKNAHSSAKSSGVQR